MPAEEYSRPSVPYLSYHVASCVPPGLQSISLELRFQQACNLVLATAGAVEIQHGQEKSFCVITLFLRPIQNFFARIHHYNPSNPRNGLPPKFQGCNPIVSSPVLSSSPAMIL